MVNSKLKMKFNEGMQRHEPELPIINLKKSGTKVNLIEVIILIVFIILIGVFLIYITK